MKSNARIQVGMLFAVLTVTLCPTFAVDGVAVSTRSSNTHSFGWHFGNIERFIITNSVPDNGIVVYNGGNARCVSISPNGSRIGFIRSDGKVCIKSNDAGGTVTVLASIPNNAWMDWPVEGFIYYTNAWQGNEMWKVNTTGTPNPERVATGLGSAMQFSIAPSLNRGTAVTCCYSGRSWSLSGSSISYPNNPGGCGAGISPDGTIFTNNQGDHASVVIRNFDGSQKYAWRANGGAGGSNWNRNRWSANSNEWVTFTQGTPYQLESGHHQVLYKIDGSQYVAVQPYKGGTYYEGDDFWVGKLGPVPPSISLSKTSLSFQANIGSANPATQSIAVSNGGDGDLPALTVAENAGWLAATVTGTGNSQTITNAINLAGLAGNVYETTVTVSGGSLSPVQYTVKLTVVAPPVLATITVSPAAAYVPPSTSKQFAAAGKDQYGAAIAVTGIQWSVGGGGTINPTTGLFTAGAVEGGPYTVTATSGSVSGTAKVSVASAPPVHIKVNCGGPAISGWESDARYLVAGNTGEAFNFGVTPQTTGLTDPAPAEVYATVRHTNHRYNFAAVPNGTYKVRLHFVDQYEADRRMDYTIEGTKVLDNFNIVTAAGGVNKPLIKEFDVTVSDNNGILIIADLDQGNDAFESGIEIIGGSVAPQKPLIKVLSPNGGEAFKVGDKLTVTWEWDTTRSGGVAVWLSANGGLDWELLYPTGALPSHTAGTNIGTFEWTILPAINTMSTISTDCRIKVWEYARNDLNDESDAAFTIRTSSQSTVANRFDLGSIGKPAVSYGVGKGVRIRVPDGSHAVKVAKPDGSVLAAFAGSRTAEYTVNPSLIGTGVYFVSIRRNNETINLPVTVTGK